MSWIVFALAVPVLAAFNLRPLFAMRSMYLPSVGLGILIAWIVAIPLRRHRSIAWAAIALLIMAAVPSAMMANRDWLVNVEVYEKMLLVTPKAAGPAIALAEIYGSRGAAENEERTLLRAAEYAQDDQSRIDVYDHLGLMYGIRGDVTKSEHYYRKVLELAPKRSSAWVGLGNNAWARGNMRSALDAYLTAVEADPANYEANNNVALAYRQLGDLSRAAEYSQRARGMQQTTVGH